MSRTFHHGYKAKERTGKNDNWYANEPKWWRKMHKHRKQRVRANQCVHRVLRGDPDVLWPLDRKPWIYYW